MSAQYSPGVNFMDHRTFTDFIFSWLANFKIDFREGCSQCGDNPSVLACDGTKLGIFFKNASFKSIEEPTCDVKVHPVHKRTDRQFFSYNDKVNSIIKKEKRLAQQDLSFFVRKKH